MKKAYESTVKCIFVSSTFKDMQNERDLIRDKVEPALNAFAEKYGKVIQLIDLRWGINTNHLSEEESSKKVMTTCLFEIDRCRPYFIGFLGNRYGWIPNPDYIKTTISNNGYHMEELDKSVTEIEIEYGVLRSQINPVCFFYMRNDLNPKDLDETQRKIFIDEGELQEKLKRLKDKINDKYEGNIRNYDAAVRDGNVSFDNSLADQIILDIKNSLEEEWGNPPQYTDKWQTKEIKQAENFIYNQLNQFIGRNNEVEYLKVFARSSLMEGPMLMIRGASGSGKSSLLSKLFDELDPEEYFILPFFCGQSMKSSQVSDMLRLFIYNLSIYLDIPDSSDEISDFSELKKMFYRLLASVSKGKRAVIIVDALDQFFPCNESRRLLWVEQDFPKNVCLICSITEGEEIERFRNLGGRVWDLPALSKEDIREITESITRQYHKELDDKVMDAIAARHDSPQGMPAITPLFLSLFIQYLLMLNRDDFKEIDKASIASQSYDDTLANFMIRLVENTSGSVEDLYLKILARIGQIVGKEFVQAILSMIVTSRNGLRESDFESICLESGLDWNLSDFSWIRQILQNNLIQRESGQWDFAHRTFREIIRKNYRDVSLEYNDKILQYFNKRRFEDSFANRELIHHAQYQNDSKFIYEILIDFIPDFGNTGGDDSNEANRKVYGQQLVEGFLDDCLRPQYLDLLMKVTGFIKPYESQDIIRISIYYVTYLFPYMDQNIDDKDTIALLERIAQMLKETGDHRVEKMAYWFMEDRVIKKIRRNCIYSISEILSMKYSESRNIEKYEKTRKALKTFNSLSLATEKNIKGYKSAHVFMDRHQKWNSIFGIEKGIDGFTWRSYKSIKEDRYKGSFIFLGILPEPNDLDFCQNYFDENYRASYLEIQPEVRIRMDSSVFLQMVHKGLTAQKKLVQKTTYDGSPDLWKQYVYIAGKIKYASISITFDKLEKGLPLLREAEIELDLLAYEKEKGRINSTYACLYISLANCFYKKNNPEDARLYANKALDIIIRNYREQQSFYVTRDSAFLLLQLREVYVRFHDFDKYKQCIDLAIEAGNIMKQRKSGIQEKQILLAAHLLKGEYCDLVNDNGRKNSSYSEAYKIYKSLLLITPVDADDLVNQGDMYQNEANINHDKYKAFILFRVAAEQGHAGAQYSLACCYANGAGTAKDYNKAVEWCEKSAEQGHPGAQFRLGSCYLTGQGVAKDYSQAVIWYEKAAAMGSETAKSNLEDIKKHVKANDQAEP